MTCTRCGARLEAERTTCGLCGQEQGAATEVSEHGGYRFVPLR